MPHDTIRKALARTGISGGLPAEAAQRLAQLEAQVQRLGRGVSAPISAGIQVATATLNDLAVTTAKLADSAVTDAKVSATAAIAGSKLQALSVGANAGVLPSTGLVDTHVAAANKDGAAATASLRTLGTGAAQAAPGDKALRTDGGILDNNVLLQGKLVAGTVRNLIGITSSDALTLGNASQQMWFSGTNPVITTNAQVLRGRTTAAVQRDLIGVDASDVIQVGDANQALNLKGSATRPQYLAADLARMADVPSDPVAGTAGLRTLGTGAQQAAAGNDSRFVTNGVAGTASGKKVTGGSTTAAPGVIATGLTTVTGFAANVRSTSVAYFVLVSSISGGDVTVNVRDHTGTGITDSMTIDWVAFGT